MGGALITKTSNVGNPEQMANILDEVSQIKKANPLGDFNRRKIQDQFENF